jgi:predicted negative regulator of RcsB-dependent stress response
MAYDLEEQEQLEGLRAFWNQYGNFILTVITIVLFAIAGYRGWGWYQDRQSLEAASVFEELRAAAEKKDVGKAKEAAGVIFEKYGGTVYAQMAAMIAARVYVDAGDLKSAKAPLQWATEHAVDDEFRHVARVRLAGILLDEKAYDEALKLVSPEAPGRFAGLYADRRGDILLAQKRLVEARSAYQQALEQLEPTSPLKRLVQIKFDSLSGAGS